MRGISDARELGAQLRAARVNAGLSQQALADKAGISRPTLRTLEQGHPTGELGKALDVLRALDLELRLAPASTATFTLDSLEHDTRPL
ncbi:helix-turn-helix domain-containing protein [Cellulomonas shaoxiangyii]|uniref:Transcriptional regulator n=1 Tax=Cellulomonas shaoxiangyii TaxID=2566013 RepID=A0A4P7SI11_9CELL|nr:helix-turn-helix domain-containing protein [Cellulomonas shaoxiangyii]QCB92776.1 transcriptional regulator [Cellulomonas shaoxiangyii]TGY84089.1 transcriptional regulator [Cellulomonas shaoxiangyii]